jgi:hypothetical protein
MMRIFCHVAGFIVLVMRGGCSFATKARNAQRAQAAGLVVFSMYSMGCCIY